MKKKLKVKFKILIGLLVFLGLILISGSLLYSWFISPISDSDTEYKIEIESGTSTSEIGQILYENELIRNTFVFDIHVRLNNYDNLQAGTYILSSNMSMDDILRMLQKGIVENNSMLITFKEGFTIDRIGEELETHTLINKDEFITQMEDRSYVKSLIDEYWFLDEVILSDDIYYPLEGYLFPETYAFEPTVTIEQVVTVMLDQMEEVLDDKRDIISKSELTVHEIITLASMIELEGVDEYTRDNISGVFYNRLDSGWSLGSDVTTCYGVGASLSDCNDNIDYNAYTPYNTRSIEMAGMLPIGAICSPSLESINASLEPEENDYYYFVADKYKEIYFTSNETEHQQVINEIKARGEWPW